MIYKKSRKKSALTMIEILIAMFILGLTLLSFLRVTQSSRQGAMDAYYEFLAQSLASEALEVFRGMGYKWLTNCMNGTGAIKEFPADGQFHDVEDINLAGTSNISGGSNIPSTVKLDRPAEASLFQRSIELKPVGGINAVKIEVRIRPKTMSNVAVWLSRSEIKMSALVFEIKP
ncbi:MAG: hypothetical protein HQM10_08135 [Candidatus Riflebacteria bacterium]|nr:hypothetical protein [Candidatus Riflebacteria bacterium]